MEKLEPELNIAQKGVVSFFTALLKPFLYLFFKLDPTLSKSFNDLHKAQKDLDDTWEELAKKRKGTNLDHDLIMKKINEM